MAWVDAGPIDEIPRKGARVLRVGGTDIAIFRTGEDQLFALLDRCPHRNGPLSQGIVHGRRVTCPLHDWVIDLGTGAAVAPDEGCVRRFVVKAEGRRVHVDVPEPVPCAGNGGAGP